MQKSGVIELLPEVCILTICGPIYSKHWMPYPVFSILNSLLGCTTLLVGNCSGLWFNPLNIWMMRDTLCSFFFLTVSRHSYFVNTFQYLAVVYNGLKKLSHFIDLLSNILTTLALQELFYLLGFSCIFLILLHACVQAKSSKKFTWLSNSFLLNNG